MRYVVEVAPGLYPAFEPPLRCGGMAALAGGREPGAAALAWRGHALIARTPLSAARLNH